MSETTNEEVHKEYQAALRAEDKDPSPENKARLEKARAARQEIMKTKMVEADEKIKHLKTAMPDKPKIEETEYERLTKEMKAASLKIKELRIENKALHDAIKENIKQKREYNYKIIPALAKQKRELRKKLKK